MLKVSNRDRLSIFIDELSPEFQGSWKLSKVDKEHIRLHKRDDGHPFSAQANGAFRWTGKAPHLTRFGITQMTDYITEDEIILTIPATLTPFIPQTRSPSAMPTQSLAELTSAINAYGKKLGDKMEMEIIDGKLSIIVRYQ